MKNVAFIALAFLSMMACKKPTNDPSKDPEKPQQTQTGADILWCKVNGTPQLYKGKRTYLNDNGVRASVSHFPDSGKGVEIYADNSNFDDAIYLFVNNVPSPEINVKYTVSNHHPYAYSQYYKGNGENPYYVDSLRSFLTFTRFDNTVAAGTFEYHGFNKNNDTVHITEGFFDIVRE